jgi:Ni2+-binding GTPase involved in maturation of urease and hydrogenase
MKNKSIIETLGIPTNDRTTIDFIGSAGVGKTTTMVKLATEMAMSGNKVLFLTTEISNDSIGKKFGDDFYAYLTKEKRGRLVISTYSSLQQQIENIFDDNSFDVIIVDDVERVNLEYYYAIAKKYKCVVFGGHQGRKDLSTGLTFFERLSTIQKSDIAISITKKKMFSLLDRIKYFVCFWVVKPNTTFKVLKNRYGKDGTIADMYLNYEKPNNS